MNISLTIKNVIRTVTLAAGEYRSLKTPGRYFLLVSNSLATNVEVAIGKDSYQTWPVLFSCRTRRDDEFFDQVRLHNPAASEMTVEYIISSEDVDNKSSEVVGLVSVIDVSSNVTSPGHLIALPTVVSINNGGVAVNKGGGKVGIPLTGQQFGSGESIWIADTVNYNGSFLVDATSSINEVVITDTYVAETFGSNDVIGLVMPRKILSLSTRRELIVYNNHATVAAWWGSQYVNVTNYGIPIPPLTTFIITTKGTVYFIAAAAAGAAGCRLTFNSLA